jgi:hypothetical protein
LETRLGEDDRGSATVSAYERLFFTRRDPQADWVVVDLSSAR